MVIDDDASLSLVIFISGLLNPFPGDAKIIMIDVDKRDLHAF